MEILKENAETEFEKLSVARLETALTAPPRVEVINESRQEFNGNVYYKSKRHGHYYDSIALHYNGTIPFDMNVHHVNENKDNNNVENLILLTRQEHAQLHLGQQQKKKAICEVCGKEFVIGIYHDAHTCSANCRAIKNRKPFKDIKITKECVVCGRLFETSKYRDSKACSPHCGAILAHQSRCMGKTNKQIETMEARVCSICGEVFCTRKRSVTHLCSAVCVNKWNKIKKEATKANNDTEHNEPVVTGDTAPEYSGRPKT